MTAADKTKLDGIAEGATKYVHPTYPEKGLGFYKVQIDVNGHIKSAVAVGTDDITALGISGKSVKASVTLLASGWSGTTSPYTNTITVSGVTATNNVEVLIPSTITAAQAESWMSAGILCGSQEADSITLKAYGDKPSIDIPIECIIRKDI